VALGVCLLFDDRTDRAIRGLWDRLEERGVATLHSHTHGSHRPHLSYVVLLRWDLDTVRRAVEGLPDLGPFEIVLDAFGVFRRGRACLLPAAPAALVIRQHAVVCAVRRAGAVVHRHYEIDRWLPHVSLAPRVRMDQLPAIASASHDVLPLTARITGAALIDSAAGSSSPLRNLP
jgi:2'-5' RNA ligase superfamily protein